MLLRLARLTQPDFLTLARTRGKPQLLKYIKLKCGQKRQRDADPDAA